MSMLSVLKSGCPMIAAMIGMKMLSTMLSTTGANAVASTSAIASSTRLPRLTNSLNSLNMLLIVPFSSSAVTSSGSSAQQSYHFPPASGGYNRAADEKAVRVPAHPESRRHVRESSTRDAHARRNTSAVRTRPQPVRFLRSLRRGPIDTGTDDLDPRRDPTHRLRRGDRTLLSVVAAHGLRAGRDRDESARTPIAAPVALLVLAELDRSRAPELVTV